MNLSEIIPSRQYGWVYEAEMKLNKGGRASVPPNPYHGRVTVRKAKSGQAATAEMVQRKSLALDPSYQPSPDYTPRWEETEHPCVVRSLGYGELAVRILNPKTVKVERFVDGRPMTAEEWLALSSVKGWLPASRLADPTKVKVNFVKLDNLSNVVDDMLELDDED